MSESQKRTARDIFFICVRSVSSLSNGIIFVVLALLFYFGEAQVAVFLSLAIVGGVLIGVVNDVRARLALEKLQLLTTPMYIRVRQSGVEEKVFAEALEIGDRIRLKLGDQVPCDATLSMAENLEISQALRTGESDSYPKKESDKVLAGDIIVAGVCVARIDTSFAQSELSKMTSTIKRYSINLSPIQQSIQKVITYSGYLLLALLTFVVARGYIVHEPWLNMIQDAAALTSTLVPQGLIVAVTLLFAYGAMRMYRDNVLMQDVNATEKLGLIKNLCIDKTGTLTENIPTVSRIHVFDSFQEKETLELTATYLVGSGDSSQTAKAIDKYIHFKAVGEIIRSLPFTSQRQFGAVEVKVEQKTFSLVMAGPDQLLPHMQEGEGQWLKEILATTERGKRLVCVARASVPVPPQSLLGVVLHPMIVFEMESKLRVGTRNIIDFFQKRGVRVRVISGDSPETVSTIAREAGIHNPNVIITGSEIEAWSEEEFKTRLDQFTIFARIRPELKENLIEHFRAKGFTAMVGDGANDALAIKKADLGIAMFEGAAATRQLASVVLTNNSFSALPEGIRLADTIIGNIHIISSLYFFEMGLGFLLFVGATCLGYSYPLSPQNLILINYYAVGFPSTLSFFWAMRGFGSIRKSSRSFLGRVVPFAAASATLAGVLIGVTIQSSPLDLSSPSTRMLVLLSFLCMNFIFFIATPFVYTEGDKRYILKSFALSGVLAFGSLYIVFTAPITQLFFNITPISAPAVIPLFVTSLLFALGEYGLVWYMTVDKSLTSE